MNTTTAAPSFTEADGTIHVLDRPLTFPVASTTTPGRSYELRVFPHARGVETTCSCPARRVCVHRRVFAENVLAGMDFRGEVRDGAYFFESAPVIDHGPVDPFDGL